MIALLILIAIHPFTFNDLDQFSASVSEGALSQLIEEVEMSGFLYQAEDGRLLLAAIPDLKSCCVGSKARIWQQVVVEGDISPGVRRVTLQGSLFFAPKKSEKSELEQVYLLKDAHLIRRGGDLFPWKTLIAIATVIVSSLLWRRAKAQ